MTDKISTEKLGGVPETMLIPLFARAVETERTDGIIRDDKAVEMVARIDYDFSKFSSDSASQLGIAIRTEILDEGVRAFIATHPHAVIVNLGAGLDTRFFRVDNGQILWYELDLPESLDVRQRFIPAGERYHYLAESALDFSWMEKIERREHHLFIAEGLLMYFDESDVKALILALAEKFPGAEMLVEVIGVSQAKNTQRDTMVSKTSASFKWGIRNAADIATWDDRITYLSDVSLYDRYEARWLALPLNWPVSLKELRNTVDRIVHLRFKK